MEFRLVDLNDFGALAFSGADATRFLQGQVSNDVERLGDVPSLLAGYHTREGRVIAILRLAQVGPDRILAILPRELVAPVAERLRKFVLRAKVRLDDESGAWRIQGAVGTSTADPPPTGDATLLLPYSRFSPRWLIVAPGDPAAPGSDGSGREEWRAMDVADGLPQIYAATSGEFVAQMLNLDVIGGIAFDKGCYTGQEVIARAHYRGRVKRRLQRFRTFERESLAPGAGGTLADGRSFKVVEAAVLADGRTEFLAVAALGASDGASDDRAAAGTSSPAETVPAPDARSAGSAAPSHLVYGLAVEPLLVPYDLPR